MKFKLFVVLTFILTLVGCSTEKDVTETYFQPGYEYTVARTSGRKFYFDELNENKFSYEGRNKEASSPKTFGLPMDVNKVGNYGEYDVISFEPRFEESRFPDYDWTQENKLTVGSGLDSTSISQRIIFEDFNFVIVPFNTDYQTYYALLPEETDETLLDELIEYIVNIDYDFSDSKQRDEHDDFSGITVDISNNKGYLLRQDPIDN